MTRVVSKELFEKCPNILKEKTLKVGSIIVDHKLMTNNVDGKSHCRGYERWRVK